jgi:spermidine synthase
LLPVPVLLLACFFLSGASGLMLEVVWVRQLTQVFGGATLAISTVLATFMGGLALGSFLGGRLADRLKRDPLRAYAVCEIGIAVLALLIPWTLGALHAANAWMWSTLPPVPLAIARFLLCALLLLPPTTLMGATLPLLARRVIRSPEDFGLLGRRVGALYAANTAGAVVGVAGAGFWLMPIVGVRATNLVAVAIDLVLGAVLLVIKVEESKVEGRSVSDPDPDPVPTPELFDLRPSTVDSRLALIAFSISGFVAMILEVLWSRALALVIGSSIYSFTLVLTVFLVGLSLGAAWIGRPAARSRDPLGVLGLVFVGIGAAIVLVHLVVDDLPTLFLSLLEGTKVDVGWIISVQAIVAGVAVAPTAACLGAVLPLAVKAYAGSPDAVGRDVGRAYAANTAGAIVGSIAGGFLVLPLVGLEWGVRLSAIADLALGLFLIWRVRIRRRVAATAFAAVAVVAVLLAPRWDRSILTSGVFRITVARRFVAAGEVYRPELLYYADGVTTTVTVERHGGRLAMKNNGKVEASSQADMPTQILVGLVPVVLHGGDGIEVAVVGYGSGVTVGAIAESPTVARVDVVEIEPRVYEAADAWFAPFNHAPHQNPRVHRYVGDGRNFLQARPASYDVIVSEPSNPWIAGVASLFTREFYTFAKTRLAPGGVFCQWAQLYELGPRNVKRIYRTFADAFPHVYAFSAADLSADTILIGSMAPLPLDVPRLRKLFEHGQLVAELRRGGVETPEDLVAMLILAPSEVSAFTAGADVNTDDNVLLEFSAPRDLLAAGRGGRFADAVYGEMWPYGHLEGLIDTDADGAASLARALLAHGKRREAQAWIERVRASGLPDRAAILTTIHALARMRDFADPELPLDAAGPPLGPASPSPEVAEARKLVGEGRWEPAYKILSSQPIPPDTDDGRDLQLLYGFVLYKTIRLDDAANILQPLVDDAAYARKRPASIYYLGRVYYGDGKFQKGAALLERFAKDHAGLVE